jgi:hypothetical protein
MDGDAIYFVRRAKEERVAALRSTHPAARQSHLELANRYEELAGAIATRELQLVSRVAG